MCGIFAIVSKKRIPEKSILDGMAAIKKRGPDSTGEFRYKELVLGHHRLSIIDNTQAADQPMFSSCGRFVIVFNGEIYNYQELRESLNSYNYNFISDSDTEVILALYKFEGELSFKKLKGMFAFIIYDLKDEKLVVARDPYGIKPLYYAHFDDGIVFSSQVKSILATKLIPNKFSLNGVHSFFLFGNVQEPFTWFDKIYPIEQGTVNIYQNSFDVKVFKFNDIYCNWNTYLNRNVKLEFLQSKVKEALFESVNRHMVADVKIGILLSGGIDSTLLVGILKELGYKDIVGITIVFDEYRGSNKDEGNRASIVAKHYDIKHIVRVVKKEEFLEDLDLIFSDMDQPTIDGINTWYATKAAKEAGLKVVLSGVGADELFFGYDNFKKITLLKKIFDVIEYLFNSKVSKILLSKSLSVIFKNDRIKMLSKYGVSIPSLWFIKRSLFSFDQLVSEFGFTSDSINEFEKIVIQSISIIGNERHKLGYLETKLYMNNQLLRDSDWASMSHGVELRTPFVDVSLLENLKTLIPDFEYFGKKNILSGLTKIRIPKEILNPNKTGFSIPINLWLNGNLNNLPDFNKFYVEFVREKYNKSIESL